MTFVVERLGNFLDEHGIRYETISHPRDYTALETAEHTGTRGKEFAKTVVLVTADGHVLAVIPAHHHVRLAGFPQRDARLATEEEIRRLFPDCEVGAEPPFGNLYDVEVHISEELAENEYITFNAGSHESAIRMAFADFLELVKPRVDAISELP